MVYRLSPIATILQSEAALGTLGTVAPEWGIEGQMMLSIVLGFGIGYGVPRLLFRRWIKSVQALQPTEQRRSKLVTAGNNH
jgi:hypothetical protein